MSDTTRLRELASTLLDEPYRLNGQWGWYGQAPHTLQLSTSAHYGVMGFDRMGMSSGQPRFPVKSMTHPTTTVWRKATEIVGRRYINGIETPVADYLAAVNAETVLALVDEVDALRAQLAAYEQAQA